MGAETIGGVVSVFLWMIFKGLVAAKISGEGGNGSVSTRWEARF